MRAQFPGMANGKYLFIAVCLTALRIASAATISPGQQTEIAGAAGPFHIEGARIIDAHGRPLLIHGTRLPTFSRDRTSVGDASDTEFGPYSASSFATVRHRFHLNTVRMPLNLLEYENDPEYLARLAAAVRQANKLQLLVILGPLSPDSSLSRVEFWQRPAGVFRGYPNVMFELLSRDEEQAARSAGAKQGVVVRRDVDGGGDANTIYEIFPMNESMAPAAVWTPV
jgi:hypothetical protein